MARVRHFFAGSNSGKGFYSLFDNIIGLDARRVYLLKGGPGTGKSSFMRYIADEVGGKGYDRELFFCSSDSGALDAVSFPELKVALLDATQPHAVDAQWPGCKDQIISLGLFWSTDVLEDKRDAIIAGGRIKQAYFAEAFRYFAAALAIEQNIAARNREKRIDCKKEIGEIYARISASSPGYKAPPGEVRHLFASALTPEGYVSFITNLVQGTQHVFVLQGGPGTGKAEHLSAMINYAQLAGYNVEALHYPLDPKQVLHLIIPELKLAVLSEVFLETMDDLKGPRITLGPSDTPANAGDTRLWRELIQHGFEALLKAQSSHIDIEEYYAEAMDFAALTRFRAEVLAEIVSLDKAEERDS